MMVNILKVSQLNAIFTKDPAIALKDYIQTNYIITTPRKADVRFDTKFGSMRQKNYIIITNINKSAKSQTLGKGRIRYTDTKNIQIMCIGKSAKNNLYLIEQHLDDIINANPTGMQSDGIDEIHMTDFQDIPTEPDGDISKRKPRKEDVFREFATVNLIYDKFQTT